MINILRIFAKSHGHSPWDLSKARDLAKDVDPYKDLRGVSFSQCLVNDIVANRAGSAGLEARIDEALPSGHGRVWEGSL